jgi:cytochrome c-type biogenesis protein CcmH
MLYARLGAMPDLQISKLLAEPESANSAALVTALVNRLEQRQGNFYYWLILARMELSEGNAGKAVEYYRMARELLPQDSIVAAELAQALFVQFDNQTNEEIEKLVTEVLSNDPSNVMALELAGIIAFASHDYRNARTYWQHGLKFIEADSPQAQALQLGISRAAALAKRELITDSGGLSVDVILSLQVKLGEKFEQIKINTSDTIYIYVREWQGVPMPLVAQRYTVADLPLEVQFTDAMSLSPARKLSETSKLEIIVRISSSGTRQATSGDFEGRIGPVSLAEKKRYTVTIDKRLP